MCYGARMDEFEVEGEMSPQELLALRGRADAGEVQAQFELGCELWGEEGAEYLRRAAVGGHAGAMRSYAVYLDGAGEVKAAIAWHKRAAALDDARSCYYLGEAYRYGVKGMRVNREKAFFYHAKAAELGELESAYALALDSLYHGAFCPWPQEEGARVLREVAEKSLNGDPLFWYAVICYEGRGMPRNPELAREWLLRCLEMSPDYTEAQELLQEVETEMASQSADG